MPDLDFSLYLMTHYLAAGLTLWLFALGVVVVGDHWDRHSIVARGTHALAWALVLLGASTVQLGVVIEMVRRGLHG